MGELATIINRGEATRRESLVPLAWGVPKHWWLRLCPRNLLIFNSLEVDGSQSLFQGGSNTPDAPPGKRRIPQEKAVLRRNSPSELRIYLKILQRRFQMFAMPPRGLKVIEVIKVRCERRYAAQFKYRKVFKVAYALGNFRSGNAFDLFSRTRNF